MDREFRCVDHMPVAAAPGPGDRLRHLHGGSGSIAHLHLDAAQRDQRQRAGANVDIQGMGRAAIIVVPSPGALERTIFPPSASTRSVSPTNPDPRRGSAPPEPSSLTWMRTRPSRLSTITFATDACACLAVLVSASETM